MEIGKVKIRDGVEDIVHHCGFASIREFQKHEKSYFPGQQLADGDGNMESPDSPDKASSSISTGILIASSDYCLFIANLPQRMTNEELAYAIYTMFKPFGAIQSVKASRDQRGRPYGFVEYVNDSGCQAALNYGPHLTLDGRRIRVEQAKRQRKLCVKYRFAPDEPLEFALEKMRKVLQAMVPDEDFKLSLQSSALQAQVAASLFLSPPSPDAIANHPQDIVAAIIKFESVEAARQVHDRLKEEHPEWMLTWINMDRSALGSNIRNSGLVQLVPTREGSIIIPAVTSPSLSGGFIPRYASPPFAYSMPDPAYSSVHASNLISPAGFYPLQPTATTAISPVPILPGGGYTQICFEEEEFDCAREEESIIRKMSNFSLEEEEDMQGWVGSTLFVGRLNGQAATISLLKEHFTTYGPISYIRLYNRGLIGFDGVPIDAYAFIKYDGRDAVEGAIKAEHGKAWLGQAIKCEHARISALGALIRNAMESRMQQRNYNHQQQHQAQFGRYTPGSPLLKSAVMPVNGGTTFLSPIINPMSPTGNGNGNGVAYYFGASPSYGGSPTSQNGVHGSLDNWNRACSNGLQNETPKVISK